MKKNINSIVMFLMSVSMILYNSNVNASSESAIDTISKELIQLSNDNQLTDVLNVSVGLEKGATVAAYFVKLPERKLTNVQVSIYLKAVMPNSGDDFEYFSCKLFVDGKQLKVNDYASHSNGELILYFNSLTSSESIGFYLLREKSSTISYGGIQSVGMKLTSNEVGYPEKWGVNNYYGERMKNQAINFGIIPVDNGFCKVSGLIKN